MAIETGDLIVLTVAMIQKYGILDTMEIEGEWLRKASTLIESEGGFVSLVFTGDPSGEFVNVTCLFSDEQREEWRRLGMVSKPMGEG